MPAPPHPLTAPEQIADQFAQAWNQADAQGLAELFTEDADFRTAAGPRPVSYQTPAGPAGGARRAT